MTKSSKTPRRDRDRLRLLQATLPHVSFDGWTLAAMRAGAGDVDMDPADLVRLFPDGPDELIRLFMEQADALMAQELERRDLGNMRMRDRIATTVRVRLEQQAPHREAIRRALALQVLPQNGPGGLRALYRTVDLMWRAAGDTATDFNFYTKRLFLSGVYTATLMFWINDESDDFEATWAFLDRRIGNVMEIEKAKARAKRWLPDPDDLVRRIVQRRRGGQASPFSASEKPG
jgi:ubiquinone biosynthesis protein COQ9